MTFAKQTFDASVSRLVPLALALTSITAFWRYMHRLHRVDTPTISAHARQQLQKGLKLPWISCAFATVCRWFDIETTNLPAAGLVALGLIPKSDIPWILKWFGGCEFRTVGLLHKWQEHDWPLGGLYTSSLRGLWKIRVSPQRQHPHLSFRT